MSQRPVVLGLLVCEQVVVEEATHNVTLVNCFTKLKAEQFPSDGHRFAVFATLADGLGDVTRDVAIQRLDDYDEIYRRSHVVRFVDPLQEVRFVLRITHCSFPVAGAYQASLLMDGEPIGQHRFQVE